MFHDSQKHSANTKAQRFEWTNKNIPQTQKHKGLDDSQKHSANTKAQRFEWTNKNIPQTQKHKGLDGKDGRWKEVRSDAYFPEWKPALTLCSETLRYVLPSYAKF